MTVKGRINDREFGKLLDRHRDRRDELNRQIVWVRKKDGSNVWRFIDPSPQAGDSPQGSDSPQPASPGPATVVVIPATAARCAGARVCALERRPF
jgi:hypothetical protein